MCAQKTQRTMRRMDIQVAIFSAALVIVSSLSIFFIGYTVTYREMIHSLTQRVYAIYDYAEERLDVNTFRYLYNPADMDTELYQQNQTLLAHAKEATGLLYLYTATQNADGAFIYQLDGLPLDAEDFRRPGDAIEPEIIPELRRAMTGEVILPSAIKATDWGKIFIAYLPVHDGDAVVGVVGVEFEAESQYNTYFTLRAAAPVVILVACLAAAAFAVFFFRRISNPTRMDLYNTDNLTGLKSRNAYDVEFENLDASSSKQAVGILLMDLNYLKRVNDQLGHQCGDDYLSLVGQVIRELLPPHAVAYRIGGDELAILLWETTPDALKALAGALEAAYLAQRPAWPVETSLAVGWAAYDAQVDENLYAMFRRADEMLYEVKKQQHERDKSK